MVFLKKSESFAYGQTSEDTASLNVDIQSKTKTDKYVKPLVEEVDYP
jgi:hypothetical protein